MIADKIIQLRNYALKTVRFNTYLPCDTLYQSYVPRLAYLLFLIDLVFMIRGYAIANLAELLLVLCFIFNRVLRAELIKAMKDSAILPLMLFYCWVFISCFWSAAEWLAIFENWVGWRKILLVPMGFVLLNNPRKAKIALTVVVVMGLLYLCVAMVDLVTAVQLWDRPYYRVAQDKNIQGLYFIIVGSYFFLLCSISQQRWFIRIMLASAGFLFFAMVVIFGISRSGYVAFLIASTVLALYFSRGRILIIGMFIGCVAAVLVTSPNFEARVEQAITELKVGASTDTSPGSATSGSVRYVMWDNTVKMILEHPVLGTGAGAFEIGYGDVVDEVTGWRGDITEDPHNHYLHVWAEYGLIAIILFLLYQAHFLAKVKWDTPVSCLLGITILSCSALALFQGVFGAFAMGRFSFTVLTILAVIDYFERQQRLSES